MYSNCLVEALKAKIKDPKNVYIFKTPFSINDDLHFMWKKGDFYYHAPIIGKSHWYNLFFHKVNLKKCSKESFDALIIRYTKNADLKTKEKVAKVTKSEFANLPNQIWGAHFENEEDLMTQENYKYFKKVMKREPIFKYVDPINEEFKLGSLEDLKKIKRNFVWKLVGLLDDDFANIYRNLNKNLKTWENLED